MSVINKSLLGIVFSGANLVLASAAFKNKLSVIYGFNAAGTGYTSFKPASAFNSLTQLVADGVYIVNSSALGYELPGAVLTAGAGAGSGVVLVDNASFSAGGTGDQQLLDGVVRSSNVNDAEFLVTVDAPGAPVYVVPVGQPMDLIFTGLAPGVQYAVLVASRGGNVLRFNLTTEI